LSQQRKQLKQNGIYRLEKEELANVAQRLNVALDGRLEDIRIELSEYYSDNAFLMSSNLPSRATLSLCATLAKQKPQWVHPGRSKGQAAVCRKE